jgi:coenzyme F420-reducing hydrogenase beta subunit/polysaccharide pyruvyl transferase WcaK-like protein
VSRPEPVTRVVTLGAASSANKGAASMLQSVIDNVADHLGPCEVTVLTTYPDTDRAEPPRANERTSVELLPATPLQLLLVLFPLALAAWALGRLGVPARVLCRTRSLRALARADVVVDLAGISFADGRGLPNLGYNTLMAGLPLLLGRPTVKCSQAMGPFEERTNRVLARHVLSRMVAVCPRGERTESHVRALGLTNVRPAADLAFTMALPDDAVDEARGVLAAARRTGPAGVAPDDGDGGAERPVVVMPSSVVHRSAGAKGIDYPALMSDLVDDIVERTGRRVVIVPHSSRPSDQIDRMNDRPTCRMIHQRLDRPEHVDLIDESLPPATLRAIIAEAEVLVTSRFHAMISALTVTTPVLVVGWSHKYAEVLSEFGLEAWVLDFSSLPETALASRVEALLADADEVRARIAEHLPAVTARSMENFAAIADARGRTGIVPPGRPAPAAGSSAAVGATSDGTTAVDATAVVTTAVAPPTVRRRGHVADSLQGVIDNDLCIGCGACMFVDPRITVRLHPEKLIYEPDHPGDERAAAVCPAVQVDFPGLHAKIFPDQEVTPYGVVDSVWLAQSTDEPRNNKASSGGMIKELLRLLLARPDVDGVIALDKVEGLDFRARLVTDPDEVDTLPGSIYHNLAQPRAIELLRENEGRYVLVAIPCQLEGIYQYIHTYEPHLAERIHTTVGLLCGWQYGHHAIRAICSYLGVRYEDIEDISYRGGGPVGKLRIRTHQGKEVSASRRVDFGYQVAFDRHFNTPRCHLCINHSNYLADLVVGDAWLPSTVFTKTGISLIICRKPATRAMLDEMDAAGQIVRTQVTTEEIRESQTDRVIFGNFAYAYGEHLDDLGLHRPLMDGPNRPHATLVDRSEVERFHAELVRKLELQRSGRYRFLKWRKATVELPRFLDRYWKWFTVRILKIKSLKGERKEIPRDQLSRFR